jgi:hypothetical protein
MSDNNDTGTTARKFPTRNGVVSIVILGGIAVLWFYSLQPSIPTGRENRDKATAFLKEQFPDREVSFPEDYRLARHDQLNAPVAVIYELIRSGEPNVARRAMDFAAEQRFGYAAPYVIERLGSGDPEMERAAQAYLRTIAGSDRGPDAESWRAWWHNPPKRFLGVVTIGQTTLMIAIPATMALAGIALMAFGRMGWQSVLVDVGPPLVGFAWLMGCFLVAQRYIGDPHTCAFGASQVVFYTGYETVVGLEDARVGGIGPWLLLGAIVLFGGLIVMFGCTALAGRRRSEATL